MRQHDESPVELLHEAGLSMGWGEPLAARGVDITGLICAPLGSPPPHEAPYGVWCPLTPSRLRGLAGVTFLVHAPPGAGAPDEGGRVVR